LSILGACFRGGDDEVPSNRLVRRSIAMTESFEFGITVPKQASALSAKAPIRLSLNFGGLERQNEVPAHRKVAAIVQYFRIVNPGHKVGIQRNATLRIGGNVSEENVGPAIMFSVGAKINSNHAPLACVGQ
jgi:hypothetical protein